MAPAGVGRIIRKGEKFEDGSCTIDYWPEMDEYAVKYRTPFTFPDGSPAYVFSSYDESTVDLHFRWMKQYGIDGVFMQRFFSVLQDPVAGSITTTRC
jgi:glycoprotein endo-alpha-1,2-mannosidase